GHVQTTLSQSECESLFKHLSEIVTARCTEESNGCQVESSFLRLFLPKWKCFILRTSMKIYQPDLLLAQMKWKSLGTPLGGRHLSPGRDTNHCHCPSVLGGLMEHSETST
ncbi:hypothetical protein NPIL_377471, partial [Nephila pilipes]